MKNNRKGLHMCFDVFVTNNKNSTYNNIFSVILSFVLKSEERKKNQIKDTKFDVISVLTIFVFSH